MKVHPYLKSLSSKILNYNKCYYVRQKNIDQICKDFGDTKMQKVKMYTKMFAHIGKEGFAGAWKDFKQYKKLRKIPSQQRTQRDWDELVRMRHDFFRLGPLWIIQILPFSGPLFILYMYTYPGSIPSWFMIDMAHQQYELLIRKNQMRAIQYFKERNIKPQQINFDKMSLDQARLLAQCLYGYYRDGTKGYNKVFGKSVPYIHSQNFSKYLIKRKLKYKFNSDLHHKNILDKMNFDQKIKWKYEQVIIQNTPLRPYEQILPQDQLDAREEYRKQRQLKQKQSTNPIDADKQKKS